MRFNTRELLLATTIAALFLTGYIYIFRDATGKQARDGVVLAITQFATISIALSFLFKNRRKRIGRPIVDWQTEGFGIKAIILAGLFLIVVVVASTLSMEKRLLLIHAHTTGLI